MYIGGNCCMVIEKIKDKIYMDDADRYLPKVILVIPEQAISHFQLLYPVECALS
jgi:hypothetical protein